MNVIIIEDELNAATDLKLILEGLDDKINVVAILYSVANAIDWFIKHPAPDLIFSDIQLGDGLSFEIFKDVKVNAPIIFCTAFDQYAIQAFESNSIDYLLKPLEDEKVAKSLEKYSQVKGYYNAESYLSNMDKMLSQISSSYKQSFLVRYREKIIPVAVSSIYFIYANNGTVVIHTSSDEEYFIPNTIDQVQTLLNPRSFFRANRQFIINRTSISSIEHYFNRRLILNLHCKTNVRIIISRLKTQSLLQWIEQE